eukprot:jgi/Tetstr1/459988/TSEL_005312.t1
MSSAAEAAALELQRRSAWQLQDADYLRRVLACATSTLRSVYWHATAASGGCPKVVGDQGQAVEAPELDAWYAAAHLETHPQLYGSALSLTEQEVQETGSWLRGSRGALARAGLDGSLEGGVVEEAFRACERLMGQKDSAEAKAYLWRLRAMWEESAGGNKQVASGEADAGGEAERDDGLRGLLARLADTESLSYEETHAALQQHSGSVEVALAACRAVVKLCARAEDDAGAEVPAELMVAVQAALQRHGMAPVARPAWLPLRAVQVDACAGGANQHDPEHAARRRKAEAATTAVAEAACSALDALCRKSINLRLGAHRRGVLGDMQEVLRRHVESAGVCRSALQAVSSLCGGGQDGTEGEGEAEREEGEGEGEVNHEAGLLGRLQVALWRHTGSAGVVEAACEALEAMCGGSAGNQAEAGRLGLMADLQGVTQHHAGSEAVVAAACRALGSMMRIDTGNREEAGRTGVMAHIQGALQDHVGAESVVEIACSALSWMCEGQVKNQGDAGRLGLITDMQTALRQHAEAEAVVLSSCGALTIMCCNDAANITEAGRLGLMADLQTALRKHDESEAVVRSACLALQIMCRNDGNREKAGRLGLMADLQSALRRHSESDDVVEAVCGALQNMCYTAANRAAAERLGLMSDMQTALRQHGEAEAVIRRACLALQNMCCNEGNKAEAGRLGLLADLQAVMRHHPKIQAVEMAIGRMSR